MVKIVFLDFDQTLFSHFTNRIPESAIEAVNTLHKRGIKIFLCSGRSLYEMKEFDLSMINIDGMIANNGQVAYDANNNIIYDYPIEGILKEEILKIFNEKQIAVFLHTTDSLIANIINEKVIKTQKDIDSSVPKPKEYNNEDIYMCSMFLNNDQELQRAFKLKEYANITYWHDGAIDIVPLGVSKANGIKNILKYYKINKEDTIAFGDADNDEDMLKYCNIGIAVGNATEKIKKVADYVSDHIDKDGIYNACKHYKLI